MIRVADRIWIYGGSSAIASNSQLLEVWEPTEFMLDMPNGKFDSNNRFRFAEGTPLPQFSLMRPSLQVAPMQLGSASTNVIVGIGWIGPRCNTFNDEPDFDLTYATLCDSPARTPNSFSIIADAPRLTPQAIGFVDEHAFGAAATLMNNQIFITGGFLSSALDVSGLAESLSGPLEDERPQLGSPISLTRRRAFHAATALPNDGILLLGGVTISNDPERLIQLADEAEVIYPERSATPR